MSSRQIFSNKAFLPTLGEEVGFNLIHETTSFKTVFNPKPLEVQEALAIEELLVEGSTEELSSEKRRGDTRQLQEITSEIKAIAGQGVALMGERIQKARDLLKPYKDGTFTCWLDATFGSRKTGYNLLAFFELYTALPDETLKESFKKMPQKVAYMLASRSGDIENKAAFIRNYSSVGAKEGVRLIQESLPIQREDRRTAREATGRLILSMVEALKEIKTSSTPLSEEHRRQLFSLRGELDTLLSSHIDV